MQVATTTRQTSRGLFVVGPDMAKVLAVVALPKSSLSSNWYYLDDNMVKDIQFEYLLRFKFLVKVTRNRGKVFTWVYPFGVLRLIVNCLTLMMLKPKSFRLSEIPSAGVSRGRWWITVWTVFSNFGEKVK
jgi:hypothetical protein